MLFERFEDKGLAQYSYAVGCERTRQMAIVDPRRDVDVYLAFASEKGMTISHVLETHIHADYASGARELAERSGAELLASAYDEGETYQVSFPHRDLREGQEVVLGGVRIEPLHTPGHTPEHLSFLVYDTARSSTVPMLLLSGDFLLVGSLGRPDLLGEAAAEGLANRLFDSVREKLAGLPDGLEIHPAHGAGSMCGAGMSGRPSSTLGFERLANPYLDPAMPRERFVARLFETAPPFPPYYRRMKRVNSEGPKLLHGLPGLEPVGPAEVQRLIDEEGHVVLDLRSPREFGEGHIPGALGIGAGQNLSTWAAWVVPYDRPILLVPPGEPIEPSLLALIRVGLDDLRGHLRGGINAWREAGRPLVRTPQLPPAELQERIAGSGGPRVLDVRGDGEWLSGHIAAALHIPAGELQERLQELPRDGREMAVICGSGYRSTVAASVLARAGFDNVINVPGGMGAWQEAGFPVTTAG